MYRHQQHYKTQVFILRSTLIGAYPLLFCYVKAASYDIEWFAFDVGIARDSESGGGVAQAVCLRSHVIWVELFGAWFWKGYERAGQIVKDYRRVSLNV